MRCPDCGLVVEADAASRCPRCGWAPGQPLRGVVARAQAPPGQAPASAAPAMAGRRRSRLALWAFILSLTPVASLVLSAFIESAFAADGGGAEPAMAPLFLLGGLGSLLYIGGPVAAIAMGLAARRDPTIDQRSRNLALAAVLVGSITLGLYVVAILMLILIIAACASACGSASSLAGTAAAAAPCASLRTERHPGHATPGARWRDALAHHPDLPAFQADVFRVAGARLCVGCFTAGPAFAAAVLAGWLWPLPAMMGAAIGLPLAAVQALSAAGWTTTRERKVAVKACFGAGSALVLKALLAAPWPEEARSLALAGCGLLALASVQPRLRRIARLAAEAPAPADRGTRTRRDAKV